MMHPWNPSIPEARQGDLKFEANLDYIRSYQKSKNNKNEEM